LKQAVALFNAQQYAEARKVLDAGEITQEQDALLAKQQRLQEEQATVTAQLDDKANEWLLKAKLTAIDYSLGDQRIAQTSGYFEKALKSGRTSERLFAYAKFLGENNQYRAAETLYTEALNSYRELANDNPAVYLPDVVATLNNLGNLVADDSQRRKEAENLYTEALTRRRQLAKDNRCVALTLNNLGILVAADSQRRKEAENLYTEALSSYRELANDNPAVYLPDVAATLWGFGEAYLNWNEPAHALPLLQESAELFAPLAQQAPGVFGEKHDGVLQLIEQVKAAKR
jgi:tetratricopeptide (TPR) repeat protein